MVIPYINIASKKWHEDEDKSILEARISLMDKKEKEKFLNDRKDAERLSDTVLGFTFLITFIIFIAVSIWLFFS